MNVVPRIARFQCLMRPPRFRSLSIDGFLLARYLIALSPPVLVHHRQNTMDFISVSTIEDQMAAIRSRIIEIGDRVRCVGNDERTKPMRCRCRVSVLNGVADPLIWCP